MSGGERVLILSTLGSDYGSYFVDRGFVDLLGTDRVRLWPFKRTHNGGKDIYPERCQPGAPNVMTAVEGRLEYRPYKSGSELWADPAYWRAWKPERFPGAPTSNDGPLHWVKPLGIPEETDDRIFEMVSAGEFGLIVLNGARWHGSAALSELRARFGKRLPPVAFVDGEDYPQRRWDFCDAFEPAVYFKRSMLVGGHPLAHMFGRRPNQVVRPLPFSASWDVPWVPWEERTREVFCVFGATQVQRARLKEVVEEVCKGLGIRYLAALGHPLKGEYMTELSRSKIVVDHQGSGTDTLRFWEASAAGACLISDLNLETPPPSLEPGVHFLQYPADTSTEGDKQDFRRFRELLIGALKDDAATHAMARRNYDAVRNYHTPKARARYVVAEVRAQGHALGGLP